MAVKIKGIRAIVNLKKAQGTHRIPGEFFMAEDRVMQMAYLISHDLEAVYDVSYLEPTALYEIMKDVLQLPDDVLETRLQKAFPREFTRCEVEEEPRLKSPRNDEEDIIDAYKKDDGL